MISCIVYHEIRETFFVSSQSNPSTEGSGREVTWPEVQEGDRRTAGEYSCGRRISPAGITRSGGTVELPHLGYRQEPLDDLLQRIGAVPRGDPLHLVGDRRLDEPVCLRPVDEHGLPAVGRVV